MAGHTPAYATKRPYNDPLPQEGGYAYEPKQHVNGWYVVEKKVERVRVPASRYTTFDGAPLKNDLHRENMQKYAPMDRYEGYEQVYESDYENSSPPRHHKEGSLEDNFLNKLQIGVRPPIKTSNLSSPNKNPTSTNKYRPESPKSYPLTNLNKYQPSSPNKHHPSSPNKYRATSPESPKSYPLTNLNKYKPSSPNKHHPSSPNKYRATSPESPKSYPLTNLNKYQPSSPNKYRPSSPNKYRATSPKNPKSYQPTNLDKYQPSSPNKYRHSNPNNYRATSPNKYRPTSPNKYRSSSPDMYNPSSPHNYRRDSPDKYRASSPSKYRSTSPIQYHPKSPNKYRPGSQNKYQPSSPDKNYYNWQSAGPPTTRHPLTGPTNNIDEALGFLLESVNYAPRSDPKREGALSPIEHERRYVRQAFGGPPYLRSNTIDSEEAVRRYNGAYVP